MRVNGDVRELSEEITLNKNKWHSIEVVVDRLIVSNQTDQTRLADSVELSLKLADGLVVFSELINREKDEWSDQVYSEHYACAEHPEFSLEALEPRLFSFNSPYGACPKCDGLGTIMEFDPDLVIADNTLGLSEGAIDAWRHSGKRMNIYYARLIRRFCKSFGIDPHQSYKSLGRPIRRILMDGTTSRDESKYGVRFEGVIPNLQRRCQKTASEYVKARLHTFMSEAACEACQGTRLRTEALHVVLCSKAVRHTIADVTGMTVEQATEFFATLKLNAEKRQIAEPILKEVRSRLDFMMCVGLSLIHI